MRWVHDEGLHLTLKFFGEVAPERLDVIAEAVRFAGAGHRAPRPELWASSGRFPAARRPRVLWVGVDAPPALELLQDRLERGAEAIGFAPEGAPFQPHVTLGGCGRASGSRPEGWRLTRAGSSRCRSSAEQLVLYESVLTTRGPRYEPRLTLELAT